MKVMEDLPNKRSCFIMSKINPASAIPPAYATQAKSTNASTAASFKEKPAYIVEIESLYQSVNLSKYAKNQVPLSKDTSENALELFRQKYLEHVDELSAVAPEEIDQSDLIIGTINGDDINIGNFHFIRGMLDRGCIPNQEDEIKKNWDKYLLVEENIAKGGKKAMLEYNLMFAGTAAYATVQVTDGYATKFIEKEIYTQDQYNKIKIFATDLQNKSGVFVSPSFDWKNATGSEIKYSYMGALCSIGVDKLDFMESHREADEIWTQLAQGAYKNNRELLQALHDGGYEDTAKDYAKRIQISENNATETVYDHFTLDTDFKKENGALWDVTIGYQYKGPVNRQTFKDLQLKYFGSDDASVTYTSEQLKEAFTNGKTEAKTLNTHPFLDLRDAAESTLERKKKQLTTLKKQLAALDKEIQEIRATKLPEESKTEKIGKFEQQKQPIQTRINDVLQSIMDDLLKNAQ